MPHRTEKYLCGAALTAQRIAVAVSLKKGSFPYDREMGIDAEAADINNAVNEQGRKKLEMLINEAAASIADCRVVLNSVNTQTGAARITINYNGEEYVKDVCFYGYV